jgi:hypothetical protein
VPDPLPGLWYVGQGSFTHGSHSGYWGYDLNKVDNALHTEAPTGSTNLGDNFSFGQPILAPVAGTASSVASTNPDLPVGQYGNPNDANFLFLAIPGNVGLLFTHAKPGTIPFSQGASVPAGALVGRVGNSGYSGWPHLHFGAEIIPAPNPNVGIPLGITNANVGSTRRRAIPWRRTVAVGIREGYFVPLEPESRAVAVAIGALALRQRRRRAPPVDRRAARPTR